MTSLTRRHPAHRVVLWLLTLVFLTAAAVDASAQSFWDDLLTGIELSIGDSVAENVFDEYGPPARLSPAERRWLDTIFNDIVAQARRKEIPYSLTVLDSEVVNAFAAPGGHLFLTTALLNHIGHDTDAVANVIGHEVAHVERKHGMNTLGRRLGVGILLQLMLGTPSEDDQVWHTIALVGTELMHLGWSRDEEHEADEAGQRMAAAAGYDPHGMVRFFTTLQELQGAEIPFLEFLSTHPLTSERIERARARANELTIAPRLQPIPTSPYTPREPATPPATDLPPIGPISADDLARSPHVVVTVEGAFTMELSEWWPKTWTRPVDAAPSDPALAVFTEIGQRGYMGVFAFRVDRRTSAVDTANEWVQYLVESRGQSVVEPVRLRRLSNYQAASFVTSWREDGVRWMHYGTTIVHGGTSYEISIAYEADGFAARRPVFDRWLQSWRAGVR